MIATERCPDCGAWVPSGHLRHTEAARSEEVAPQHLDVERKPDGWHTYHICGGELRELTRIDGHLLYCVWCNTWLDQNARLAAEEAADG